MSPFILTQAISEVQVCIVGRGTWGGVGDGERRGKKKKEPPKTVHTDQKVPPISVHTVLFHHLKLAVKSTVVPNIYLHTKNS